MGHGGTLDPFATGLLVVLVGRAATLARYFLGATKSYEGDIEFGKMTDSGDPTGTVTETSQVIPQSIEPIQDIAKKMSLQNYLQTPPMYSAKKRGGKPLYELARQGIEVEREPKVCQLHLFEIPSYAAPVARFRLVCSSGTYVRTLAQDLARILGTVGLLSRLVRTGSGVFKLENALSVELISKALGEGLDLDELPCWIPFNRLLDGYKRTEVNEQESKAISNGQQDVLTNVILRSEDLGVIPPGQDSHVAIYHKQSLVAVANRQDNKWSLERVFAR
jgi:tRNA pseudouridine55 synthase